MKRKYIIQILILALATFIANISELLPSGVLLEIADNLNVSESKAGSLIGLYAVGSAIAAVPMITLTIRMSRKKLFNFIFIGFAISSLLIPFTKSFEVALYLRILGGICAGTFWPMVAAYSVKIMPEKYKSKSIPLIMLGSTFGVSFGIPLFTHIGKLTSWRFSFILLGILILLVLILSNFFLLDAPGETPTSSISPLNLIKNKHLLIIVAITVCYVIAHYSAYVYNNVILREQNYSLKVQFALLIFGIGSIISLILASKISYKYLWQFSIISFSIGALSMYLISIAKNNDLLITIALLLWGIAFGSALATLQTSLVQKIPTGTAVATSIQSGSFDASIMLSTSIGGYFISNLSVKYLLFLSMGGFFLAAILSFFAKKTFYN